MKSTKPFLRGLRPGKEGSKENIVPKFRKSKVYKVHFNFKWNAFNPYFPEIAFCLDNDDESKIEICCQSSVKEREKIANG